MRSVNCTAPLICLNGCRGRGQCLRGVCRCEHGFWGQDCSSTRDANGNLAVLNAAGPDLLVSPNPNRDESFVSSSPSIRFT